MRFHIFRILLAINLLAVLLAGCSIKTSLPLSSDPSATPEERITLSPQTSLTAAATVVPTSSDIQTPTLTEVTSTPQTRITSGWTMFTNPDFITGITVYQGQVWASTLGGVVYWDLETGKGHLFTTYDGLVEIQGNDIVSCSVPEDRLFIAHDTGTLSVYIPSLQRWDRMPITFKDGSTMRDVQTLFCDPNSARLLAGGRDGLGILDLKTNEWKHIGSKEGLNTVHIRKIDASGQTIWIAAGEDGAFLVLGNTVFPFNSDTGFLSGRVNDVALGLGGSVWLGYPTGLIYLKDRVWTSYGAQTPNGIPFYSVDQVEFGPDKKVWITSASEGVCPFDPATLFCSVVYPGLADYPYTDLYVDSNGVAFAGTSGGGILILYPDRVRQLAFQKHQLVSNQVMDIAEDDQGSIWLATDHGINDLNPSNTQEPWQGIGYARDKLVSPDVMGLRPTANGMWIFYRNKPQASFYDGKTWTQLDEFKGIQGRILDVAIDYRGYAWFATDQGIDIWDGALLRNHNTENANSPQASLFYALFSQGDSMWIGTNRGLWRYRRFEWEWVLPDIAVHSIVPDPSGGLLLGTDEGLVRYKDNQSFFWIINLGQESVLAPHVTTIATDRQNHLWVGSAGQGLFHYDGIRWERFTTANGLPSNTIQKVYVDHLGSVWISTITGTGGGALVRYVP